MATSPFAKPLGTPIFRWFDPNGAPAALWQVETFMAGTNTPAATYPSYADALAGSNPNSNPAILDGNGAAQIWMQALTYKIVVKRPALEGGAVVYTQDNVNMAGGLPVPALSGWMVETRGIVSYIAADQFMVAGADLTATYHAMRRVMVRCTGGDRFGTVITSSYAASNTYVTVAFDTGSIDAGTSTCSYGLESYASPAYLTPRSVFQASLTTTQTNFTAWTKLANWTMVMDSLSEWDGANKRFIAKHPGYYSIIGSLDIVDAAGNTDILVAIYLNGAATVVNTHAQAGRRHSAVQTIINMIRGDYVELWMKASGTTSVIGAASPAQSLFIVNSIP